MASIADCSSHQRDEEEFNLREWDRKARIARENTISRRFSASYIRSFREDTRSFRSNITISSTASSPGYPFKDEIDPSTYSFTTALKALQAKAVYNNWDWLTPDGFSLNSKWNEAEKYICNPLSGEVPMECLSAKTLSGRSFRNLTNRITMSAPLVYPSHSRQIFHTNFNDIKVKEDHKANQVSIQEKKMEGMKRDVGTQSTPADLSSGSPSPAMTPPITEKLLKPYVVACDSPIECMLKLKGEEEVNYKVEGKEGKADEESESEKKEMENKEEEENNEEEEERKCKSKRQSGCLSLMRKRHREKHKPRGSKKLFPINLPHLKGCTC